MFWGGSEGREALRTAGRKAGATVFVDLCEMQVGCAGAAQGAVEFKRILPGAGETLGAQGDCNKSIFRDKVVPGPR
jgi:hypothetical protein